MNNQRPDLGFSAELDSFDPQTWTPQNSRVTTRLRKDQVQEAAGAAGFQSRESAPKPAPQRTRRRRTGRNTQFNIKTRPEVIEAFCRIADANGWGLGETLEYAVELMEREPRSKSEGFGENTQPPES